jgi:hypothetical protein
VAAAVPTTTGVRGPAKTNWGRAGGGGEVPGAKRPNYSLVNKTLNGRPEGEDGWAEQSMHGMGGNEVVW